MNDLENKLFFEALVETNLMTSKINLPGNPAGVMVRDETEKEYKIIPPIFAKL